MIKRTCTRNVLRCVVGTAVSLVLFVCAAPVGAVFPPRFHSQTVDGTNFNVGEAPPDQSSQPATKPAKPMYVHGENPPPEACRGDIRLRGVLADVLANALRIDFDISAEAPALLDLLRGNQSISGEVLFQTVVAKHSLDPEKLKESIRRHQHTNCKHGPVDDSETDEALAGWKAVSKNGTPPTSLAVTPVSPNEKQPPDPAASRDHPRCSIDLVLAGMMKDIVSNALMLGLNVPEHNVAAFLAKAEERYTNGPEVLKAAAEHFKITEAVLAAEVEKFKHINCDHDSAHGAARLDGQKGDAAKAAVSTFAKDVTLHVVLHELGHAIIREFDVPVLGNEETMADAFATYYLTTYLPDRALDVLTARVTSLMIEAGETSEVKWGGEHDHDARRANQIAALAVAADPKYNAIAAVVGMSESEIKKARDYGSDIRRAWRRVLTPLWMPEGAASSEARVVYDAGNEFLNQICASGLATEIESVVKRFDWHSQVTIRFVDGDGGAAWSRSGRTITVHSQYIRRFIGQGERGLPTRSK